MADLTPGAAAMRRLRLRRAGLLPDCPDCGRKVRSARTAPLCSRCWRLTPAGREWNRQRMAAARHPSPAMRTYTVTVEHRYGVGLQYITWHHITLDAASEEDAGQLACLRFPVGWTVEAIRARRHEYAP